MCLEIMCVTFWQLWSHMICNFNNIACSLLLSNFYLNEKEQLATLQLIIIESFGCIPVILSYI